MAVVQDVLTILVFFMLIIFVFGFLPEINGWNKWGYIWSILFMIITIIAVIFALSPP